MNNQTIEQFVIEGRKPSVASEVARRCEQRGHRVVALSVLPAADGVVVFLVTEPAS